MKTKLKLRKKIFARGGALFLALVLALAMLPMAAMTAFASAYQGTLTIYEQIGTDGAKTVKGTITAEQLETMSTTSALGFMQYYPTGNIWRLYATNKHVSLENLLSTTNSTFEGGDLLQFVIDQAGVDTLYQAGNPASVYNYSYEDYVASKYFYPNTVSGTTATSIEGAVEVGSVLGLSYSSNTNAGFSEDNAQLALTGLINGDQTLSYRFLSGLSQSNYLAKTNVGGNRFPYDVTGIIVVHPDNLSYAKIDPIATVTHKAAKHTPAVKVKIGSKTLVAGTDYSVAYSNNINKGTAKVTITGKGIYTGTKTSTFTIKAASLTASATKAKFSGVAKTYKASKKQLKKGVAPKVKVKAFGKTLKKGTDYTLTYKSHKKAGTAKVTIKGKGNYSGSKTIKYKIKKK